MEVVCGDPGDPVQKISLPFSYILMKKNLIIGWVILLCSLVSILVYALMDTEKSLLADIKSIREDREDMYDDCLQSCMDKRTPYDNRVVEKQKKLQEIKKK